MDIGRIIYKMQAVKAGSVPEFNGKLIHGAVFHILKSHSAELADTLHDETRQKPFTVSPLRLFGGSRKDKRNWQIRVAEGQEAEICITAFSEALLDVFLAQPIGEAIAIGRTEFRLQEICQTPEQHSEAILLTKEEFMESMPPKGPELVTLRFDTPTTFRIEHSDYPFPEPKLVWSSLAMKWNQADMPEPVDFDTCRALSEQVVPWKWKGETVRLKLNNAIAVTGFKGTFTYSLYNLSEEQRRLFYRLACFAEFAGVGRLTAQGMGQMRLA